MRNIPRTINGMGLVGIALVMLLALQSGAAQDVTAKQEPCSPQINPPKCIFATDGLLEGTVLVVWRRVPDALGYEVYCNTEDDFSTAIKIAETEFWFYLDGEAKEPDLLVWSCQGPAKYYYWVTALDACGPSAPSESDRGHRGYLGSILGTVFQIAFPVLIKTMPEAVQPLGLDDAISVRMCSTTPIDPASVWGEVTRAETMTTDVAWRPAEGGDTRKGWVEYMPEAPWEPGEWVTLTVGARTVSGAAVEPVCYLFRVIGGAE